VSRALAWKRSIRWGHIRRRFSRQPLAAFNRPGGPPLHPQFKSAVESSHTEINREENVMYVVSDAWRLAAAILFPPLVGCTGRMCARW